MCRWSSWGQALLSEAFKITATRYNVMPRPVYHCVVPFIRQDSTQPATSAPTCPGRRIYLATLQSTFEFLVLGSYYRDMLRHFCRFGFLSVWSAAWPHVVAAGHGRYVADVCWVCIRRRPLGVSCPAADLAVSLTAMCHRVLGKEWIFRITEVTK